MKYLILIALQISAFAMLNFDDVEKKVYKDEPIEKNFVDSEWQCTKEQLDKAREKFSKCYGLTIFRDCYAQEIMKHCERRLF